MFEKIPINQALQGGQYKSDNDPEYNHLIYLIIKPGSTENFYVRDYSGYQSPYKH